MKRLLATLVVGALLVPRAQMSVDAARSNLGPEPDVSSVWTGKVAKALSFGFADVLADLYWMRAIQYYGTQKQIGTGFANLYPLLDTAVELDPRFSIVYRYGAVFLSEPLPIGAGRPEIGIALLSRGADRNPTNWQLRQEEGLFTFFYLGDAIKGANILDRAARIPDAPSWMSGLAAQILSRGGELEASLSMWAIIRDQSEPGPLRDNASVQLEIVRAKLHARNITTAVQSFRERGGDTSLSLPELRRRGVVDSIVDSTGVQFDFDTATGTARISRGSTLWRRH